MKDEESHVLFLVTVTNGESGGSENTSTKTLHIKQQQVDDDWGSDGMDAIFKQMKPKRYPANSYENPECHWQVSPASFWSSKLRECLHVHSNNWHCDFFHWPVTEICIC